tara:strand:- start:129 stop:761 length:633 start_codon:yes stop_codon:yes gene_type:complete
MKKKFKIISENLQKNLIEFLDEIQFDAATDSRNAESMHKIEFCTWAINELLNSYDGYLKENPKKKSRQDYVDETFMDWNLPEMDDKEYEKLVDQFDDFLRAWEKEYNKKNPKKKIKREPREEDFVKPHIEDVAEYMSLSEIEEYLKDDPELTDWERFDLYYEERERIKKIEEKKKEARGAKSLEQIMKELNIKPSDWNSEDDKGKPSTKK